MTSALCGPVFAFDNYFSDSELAGDCAAQAALLQRLGYGATYHSIKRTTPEGWAAFCAWEQASRHAGLPVAAYYTVLALDAEPPHGGHALADVIDHLPPGAVLELAISMAGARPSDPARDEDIVCALAPLVARARERSITISLYHHIWFLLERIEDCLRIAQRFNDPSLRVTFCAYHWYAVDGSGLADKIRLAAPWMRLANVCGSRMAPATALHAGCLPKTIEPVGEGDFPLDLFVHALADARYAGPIGFQGYKIAGHPSQTLPRSIRAWQAAVSRNTSDISIHHHGLAPQ